MANSLISLGLDVGTTSTQMVFSRLTVENRAGSFSVPELEIARREILYQSAVHFTPLLSGNLVDAPALRTIVDREYALAGLTRQQVDTGAIIITGETSRRENARAVLEELSGYAGDFVVATAGPDLESALAAKGAGAVDYSLKTGKTVLHMDIGGGTSNLALIRDGIITATGCLNVGGRLLKFDKDAKITYLSPVITELTPLHPGTSVTTESLTSLAQTLTQALEMAAGLLPADPLLAKLWTHETGTRTWEDWLNQLPGELTLSFSGGVADCIGKDIPWQTFGDLGPILGRTIRNSRLCAGDYVLGRETIRATVIGAGSHSAQLSGSTVFHRGITFPLKNLPVIPIPANLLTDPIHLKSTLATREGPAVLALSGPASPSYGEISRLASAIAQAHSHGPVLICLEQDMAKALGHALAARFPETTPILCIDRVKLTEESYLDIAAPLGPALPVVVKTLILSDFNRR